MEYDVWKTLYTHDFDMKKYLYHYTNIDKAIKIVCSQGLRFSPITLTNDTSESKVKISFLGNNRKIIPHNDERVRCVEEYLLQNRQFVRLLCFSMDVFKPKDIYTDQDKERYYDVLGRGFALPRMWSQYASNNEGVCFIINKQKFEEQVKKKVAIYKSSKVVYKSLFDSYTICEKELEELMAKIHSAANGKFTFVSFFQDDKKFLKYNFFEKLKDWENECEFRYIAIVDDSSYQLIIDSLFDYIEGVVIGENIDRSYEEVIKKLIDGRCDIKKICFGSRICKLE